MYCIWLTFFLGYRYPHVPKSSLKENIVHRTLQIKDCWLIIGMWEAGQSRKCNPKTAWDKSEPSKPVSCIVSPN